MNSATLLYGLIRTGIIFAAWVVHDIRAAAPASSLEPSRRAEFFQLHGNNPAASRQVIRLAIDEGDHLV